MGGFALDLDAILFAVVGRSQLVQLLCQVILPLPVYRIESGTALKAEPPESSGRSRLASSRFNWSRPFSA